MDGWGKGINPKADAISFAHPQFVSSLYHQYPNAELITCGEAVGLPEGQMGNSEVGHLNLGAGRIAVSYTHLDVYKRQVYNLALHYVHNSEDAEEITQDVFVKIFQKINQFQNQSELKTWIYRITINQSLDYIKARKSKKRWAFFKSADIDLSLIHI